MGNPKRKENNKMKKILFVAMALIMTLLLALPAGAAMAGAPPQYEPEYWIAAHAVVQLMDGEGNVIQEETAWADCNNSQDFPGNNWAWYFTYPGNNNNRWGLYAGNKGPQMGWVAVEIVGDNFEIQYGAFGNWRITETHVAVAESFEGIPQTKSGNPKVGKFAILDGPKSGIKHDPPVKTYTYTYPLSP